MTTATSAPSVVAGPCPRCRGTGRRGHPDATVGVEFACPGCDGTGRAGEGRATAAELWRLQAAAQAAGLDAAALRAMSQRLFGEVPERLREKHLAPLLLAIAARWASGGRAS